MPSSEGLVPRSVAEDLRRSALFAGLPPALLDRLAEDARIRVVERRGLLWAEGSAATDVALVLSGGLKSVRTRGRRQAILDLAMPGDVLGDLAFALREPHSTSVFGVRRSRVMLIPGTTLRAVFGREPRALFSALFSVGRRVQRLMRLVDSLSAGSVPRRLAAMLVDLAERAGEPFPGGLFVPVRLRRGDLGALAATSAESVSRHLAAWQRQGLLTIQPVGYLLRDLESFRRLARGAPPPQGRVGRPGESVGVTLGSGSAMRRRGR